MSLKFSCQNFNIINFNNCKYGTECYNLSCPMKHPNDEIKLQKISPLSEGERRNGVTNPVGLQCMLESSPKKIKK